MRQSLAKASRREIRRAFGAQAIGVVDRQADAISSLGIALNAVRADVAELAKDHAVLKQATRAGLEAGALAREPLRRNLMGRLRWLLTGR